MVGVSDDVNEYAIALRDTEDKLRRCPKRVRKDWMDRWVWGREGCTQRWLASPGFSGQALSLLLGTASAGLLSLPLDYTTSGRAGLALGRSIGRSPVTSRSPGQGAPAPHPPPPAAKC